MQNGIEERLNGEDWVLLIIGFGIVESLYDTDMKQKITPVSESDYAIS